MKTLSSRKRKMLLIGGAINSFILLVAAAGVLVILPAPSAFANDLANSKGTLTLTPATGKCTPPNPNCLVGQLTLQYTINHSPSVKPATLGVFQNNCQGPSTMVNNTLDLTSSQAMGSLTEKVTLTVLPTNQSWYLCLFTGQGQPYGTGKFMVNGTQATATLHPNIPTVSNSSASLTLTENCTANQIPCVGTLTLNYTIKTNVRMPLALIGVFQNNCQGLSMLVDTTNTLGAGSGTGSLTPENVVLPQKIPTNGQWVFCLFTSQTGPTNPFIQGSFVTGNGNMTATATLAIAPGAQSVSVA